MFKYLKSIFGKAQEKESSLKEASEPVYDKIVTSVFDYDQIESFIDKEYDLYCIECMLEATRHEDGNYDVTFYDLYSMGSIRNTLNIRYGVSLETALEELEKFQDSCVNEAVKKDDQLVFEKRVLKEAPDNHVKRIVNSQEAKAYNIPVVPKKGHK